ncbi:DUF2130 domain-containing protein [Mesorhizobium sp. L103C105A0]|uniref:DUF2130 domain-containing protein n=1 Tax=Mesorhizobium sp. L103C105A0 TaxID=1287074 RepID=UPI00041831A5|nr:DUF2130 domain-containing protein [Mesorhizobium sp. L103C105A0]
MPASHAPLLKTGPGQAAPHLHFADEVCPTCDQPIPHDHYEEIKEKIELRQREQLAEIAGRLQELQEQHAREKAQALEQARQEAEARIAAAREDERRALEVVANERVSVAERAGKEALGGLQAKLDDAQAAQAGAEAKIEKFKEEMADKEKTIRAEAMGAAEAAMLDKFADSERQRKDSEAALNLKIESIEAGKAAAEAASVTLEGKLEQQQLDHVAAIEKVKSDAVTRETEYRQRADAAAAAAVQEKVAGLEEAKAQAEAKATSAVQQVQTLHHAHEAQLQEQREVLEKARDEAVNAEKSLAFEERLKLQTKFEELKRAYDKKTADELGEGAEVDLYEDLKREFEGDKIERVNRGQPGADILHTVMHNGKECGTIIYDSKNHAKWRFDFVTKLASDQMAAKADHAILSTRVFPAKVRHLQLQDGVILANPARVVAIVQIVRQHLIQTHKLRLSTEERTQKTAALYDFITSERCAGMLARIDTHTEDLLDLQVKEKKAHDATWRRQGELIRSVQRVRGELTGEIDAIVGTSENALEDLQ